MTGGYDYISSVGVDVHVGLVVAPGNPARQRDEKVRALDILSGYSAHALAYWGSMLV